MTDPGQNPQPPQDADGGAVADAAAPPAAQVPAAAQPQVAPGPHNALRYFDEVLAVEIAAINGRRQLLGNNGVADRGPVEPLNDTTRWRQSPHDERAGVNADDIQGDRMRPQPVPCSAVGVALSGGGVRSAAVCLGALQALNAYDAIAHTDYLSTVSGGGYIGACMTARMSQEIGEPAQRGIFPFDDPDSHDIRDNEVVGYIRNFSNYLMPRVRSGMINLLDVNAILWRGWLANAVVVLNALVGAAMLTFANYPNWSDLLTGNFLVRSIYIGLPWMFGYVHVLAEPYFIPFISTVALACVCAVVLLAWALIRSLATHRGNDANSGMLILSRFFIGLFFISVFLDLQPLCVYGLGYVLNLHPDWSAIVSSPLLIGAITVALFARRLGAFLETTRISSKGLVQALRIITQVTLAAAGMILPLALLALFWYLTAWLYDNQVPKLFDLDVTYREYAVFFGVTLGLGLIFTGNAYSLHQFYKDRLTRAFLFRPNPESPEGQTAWPEFKLSHIATDHCPYHIINAALNVQGSIEANRRGRNAEFFTFTRDFVGSDLTHFLATKSTPPNAPPAADDMESLDPRLNVGTAMAISGAALSANMGSSTVRLMSPTLALLNIRLGYWLRNPRALIAPALSRLIDVIAYAINNLYLLGEMLNLLDEKSGYIYLSDGGHVENLGIYELLKRGCKLIIAIDAEADPDISCASLLRLERYARIDLGIRIILPWEKIAWRNDEIHKDIDPRTPERAARHHGEHCAVGPILYADGSHGILLYFKSSLSGDEKDYVLDYKKRNMDFPHENTGDQFFTEEQFEVYRSLGYHIVDGFFSGADQISHLEDGRYGWANAENARADVLEALGTALTLGGRAAHAAAAAAAAGGAGGG